LFIGDKELWAADNGVVARFPGGGTCRSDETVWGLDWWGGAAAGVLGSAL
jgi:hypothetical protein